MRVRTTAGAVAVVGVALLLGAVTLVRVVRAALTGSVRAVADIRAGEIAAVLFAGGAPSLAVGEPDEQLIQILDRRGRVDAASEDVTSRPAVTRPAPGES
ncbi:MAG TPA: hypothetical protein VH969_03605, partial [Actinophytocola sp.]|uniref:hypothetical protein n=1 Tax=Actinophytocola sp. TaxID=1872138 RepID=UPI002F938688